MTANCAGAGSTTAEMPRSRSRAQTGADFRVEPVTTIDAWQTLAKDWDRLLRATRGCTGLQSFDFLFTWWSCLAAGKKLWILTFYEGSTLAGIAPMQIVERRILGKRYRVLQFIAMTEDILRPTMLFPPERRQRLLAALNRVLDGHRELWDLIELDELASTDPLIGSLRQLAEEGGDRYRTTPFHPCPFLELGGLTPESYWQGRSRKLRKNVRASERKLAEIGPVDVEVYRSPGDVGRGFETFRRLARSSWKHEAKIGMAEDARYETFYERLLERYAQRHGARVLVLTVSGQPVAATFAVLFDGAYHALQIVHDEAYARYSPGTLLESHELSLLLGDGETKRYEFMGGALSNKLRWADDTVETVCVRLERLDWRLRAVALYEAVKPAAKRVLRRRVAGKANGPSG